MRMNFLRERTAFENLETSLEERAGSLSDVLSEFSQNLFCAEAIAGLGSGMLFAYKKCEDLRYIGLYDRLAYFQYTSQRLIPQSLYSELDYELFILGVLPCAAITLGAAYLANCMTGLFAESGSSKLLR